MARGFLPESIRKRVSPIIAAVLTVAFLVLGIYRLNLTDVNFLTRVEFLWMDAKFRIRSFQQPGNEVVLVGMDDRTLDKIGSGRIFQRSYMASVIDKLAEAKPKVIGFDMIYPDVDPTNPENDKKFAESIQKAGNVVLGVYLQLLTQTGERREATPLTEDLMSLVIEKQVFPAERRQGGASNKLEELIQGKDLQLAIPPLMKAAASFGFVNFHRDTEGGLRYQPQFIEYEGRLWPSLDIQLTRHYLAAPSPTVDIENDHIASVQIGNYELQTDQHGRYMLNFDGPRGWHQTISMLDVLEGKVAPEIFKDKIVIIGSPAIGLGDIVVSPFDPTLPAMELHANVIDNFLHQRFLYRTMITKLIDVMFIVLFGVVAGVYLPRMDAKRSIAYSLFLLALFTVINILTFLTIHWVLSFVYPGLALVATSGGVISWKYLTEEKDKKRTKDAFKTYLDEHVVDQVVANPDLLRLGGEKREMSVLFSDIRGFTSFSEKMAPTEVVHFLNQYFDKMQGLIFLYKGTLDKLIGDAVMCFWGAPLETRDHALRAVLCALEMVHAVEDLRPVLILPGGAKFEIGIGVNAGPMVVGNMGSETRMSYTVMGDNVNLGSRLESLNKYYGTRILISDTAYEDCKHIVFCRQLDTIQVKGKSQAVTIYEPLGIRRLRDDRRRTDRRGELTTAKKVKRTIMMARFGERRNEERRMGSDRLVLKPEQEELATMYEHALSLYRQGEFDAAEMAFDHVLTLSPNDGPSRLMKGRIAKYRLEYAGATSKFDGVYKFDEK